jgi:hypothetical protein
VALYAAGGAPDLKARVLTALGLLLVAKLATIAGPFTFKWATDALVQDTSGAQLTTFVLAVPLAMTAAYGGTRILMAVLTQARDGLFAKVAMNAVRRLAILTFEHMHQLSLRFHLERKTGGLTRVLERGRNGIETIVRMVILQLADHRRSAADLRRAAPCSTGATWCHRRHGRAVHVVHYRDRVADRHLRRQMNRRATPTHQAIVPSSTTRPSSISAPSSARPRVTTISMARYDRRASGLCLARRPQRRPGRDLHRRPDCHDEGCASPWHQGGDHDPAFVWIAP